MGFIVIFTGQQGIGPGAKDLACPRLLLTWDMHDEIDDGPRMGEKRLVFTSFNSKDMFLYCIVTVSNQKADSFWL